MGPTGLQQIKLEKTILVASPPEMRPLSPPHTGSCLSTPDRCHLSPTGRRGHSAGSQLPETLVEKQSLTSYSLFTVTGGRYREQPTVGYKKTIHLKDSCSTATGKIIQIFLLLKVSLQH